MQVKGEVHVYKNGELVAYSDQLIMNDTLKYLPLCLISYDRSATLPTPNTQFTSTPATTFNLLSHHNVGTDGTPPAPAQTNLLAPIFSSPQDTNFYVYNFDTNSNPRKCFIRALKTFTFEADYSIKEYGAFSYIHDNWVLIDRVVFSPAINVSSGDSITFVYSMNFNVA